ncbi:hypothetical protein GCM10010342_13270 [Streptomyces anulatus]|nr:hypothetical protein GCM10010342_13270 [Streptomyces anulatus]
MGVQDGALGGDHREIVHRQALVTAVQAEHLAQDTEFEGVDLVEEEGGDIGQHASSVAAI